RAGEPGVHRRMLAEVPFEADGADARVLLVQPLECSKRSVGRAVVDEDELVRVRPRVESRDGAPVELGERVDLVVQRDNERDVGRRRLLARRTTGSEDVGLDHQHARAYPAITRPRDAPPPSSAQGVIAVPTAALPRPLLILSAIALYLGIFVGFVIFEVP